MSGVSRRDLVLAFAALVGVAVLVGMAVRPESAAGGFDLPREPLVVAVQTVVWLVLAADILMTAAIVDALWYSRRLAKPRKPRHWITIYLGALVPSLLAAVLIVFIRKQAGGGALTTLMSGAGAFGAPRLGPTSGLAGSPTSTVAPWLGLVLAALIVIAFLGWLFWPDSKRRETGARVPQLEAAVAQAVEESLDVLRAMPDPRQAIIASYSSMERSMSRAGWPRRLSEAPLEFVTRMLAAVAGMSDDLTRLTELFEVAKFSDHVIDEGMRDDAIGALSGIRNRLLEATPAPA
ncbi:MAG TPA: DUF4129 domain-containing protein [Candidatus Dormibacteraeota bacterium]|nr:DUF4129 domain-containing protein [Candidatus Dormibacteraeota bacterium]